MAAPLRRIAVGQFTASHIIAQNLLACQNLVQKAVAANASILFLPEASDYISRTPSEALSLCVPASSSPFVLGLQQLAREHTLAISVGIHEPATSPPPPSSPFPSSSSALPASSPTTTTSSPPPPRVKNTAIYISPTGAITQRYQKLHVFDVDLRESGGPRLVESATTEPGTALTAPFDTPAGALGLLICFDLRFPEPALALRRQGAEVLQYPSAFTVPTGRAHWEVLLRARAVETQCWVVAAAQIGWHAGVRGEGRCSWGQSLVVDPWGVVRARLRSVDGLAEGEGLGVGVGGGAAEGEVGVVDLEEGVVEKVRREMPLKRRTDVYPEV